jgi:DNA-binding FadR family transcriptional regulator
VAASAHTHVELLPLQHEPAHRVVADAIRTRLALGELRPGDRLPPERVLAERLGVGRMTVRQALRELAAEGLLVTSRGRHGGTVVADEPRPFPATFADAAARYTAELRENYEFRMTFEPSVARLAAERIEPAEAAALRRLAAEPTTTVPMYRAVDSRFHLAVAQASRNRHAVGAVRRARASLFAWADALWVDQDWSRHEPTVERTQRDHEAIAAAIAAGDAALAERRMHEHLVLAVEAFTGVIDDVDAAAQAATARTGEGGETCRR